MAPRKRAIAPKEILTYVGITITTLSFIAVVYSKGFSYAEKKISNTIDNRIELKLQRDLRDLKIMVQYNKIEAMETTDGKRRWNRAIDIVDSDSACIIN